jgi:hypothetical protein
MGGQLIAARPFGYLARPTNRVKKPCGGIGPQCFQLLAGQRPAAPHFAHSPRMLPAASIPALSPTAESGWVLVHELQPDHPASTNSLAEVGALLLYYQRVAQVSGKPADVQRAVAWLAELGARLRPVVAGLPG